MREGLVALSHPTPFDSILRLSLLNRHRPNEVRLAKN